MDPISARLLNCHVMAVRTQISPEEAADRLALGELVGAHAHCADRRDANRNFTAAMHSHPFSTISAATRLRFTSEAKARSHAMALKRLVSVHGSERSLRIASIPCLGRLTKLDAIWHFAQRGLFVDSIATMVLAAPKS